MRSKKISRATLAIIGVGLVAANLPSGAWADSVGVAVPPQSKTVVATATVPAIPATEGFTLLTITVDGEKQEVAIPSTNGQPASQMTIDFIGGGDGGAELFVPAATPIPCALGETGTMLSITGLKGSGSGSLSATLATTGQPTVTTPALPVSDLSKGVNVTTGLCVEET